MPWAGSEGSEAQPRKYNGKEWVEAFGYDNYLYGARDYYAAIGRFTVIDPLAYKTPHISPYAYCANNPIKYVDPDGREVKLRVRKNTITVCATYYALQQDYMSAQQAVQFWNNQDDLKYIDVDGHSFSVVFNLNVAISTHPRNSVNLKLDKPSNSYEVIHDIDANKIGIVVTGRTKSNRYIQVRESHKEKLTGAHEVGHTLMRLEGDRDIEHSQSGVMTSVGNVKERSHTIDQETVNKIIESNNFNNTTSLLWEKIKSIFK